MLGISLDNGIAIGIGGTGLPLVPRTFAAASFFAPLKPSLSLALGTGVATFTRATTATVIDQDGVIRTALAGEARFSGARRVQNYAVSTENNSGVAGAGGFVQTANSTVTTTSISLNSPNASFWYTGITATIPANSTWIGSSIITSPVPITICVVMTGNTQFLSGTNINIPANIPTRVSLVFTPTASQTFMQIGIDNRAALGASNTSAFAVTATKWQLENVTGQTNQNPAEYVSNGVLAAPYHGAGVDGVQYFPYLNGNTVTNHVVTQAQGAAIPDSTLLGYLPEGAATNFAFPSGPGVAAATCTTATLTAASYTLSFKGTGSVTGTGGFVGTLNGTGANNRVSLTVTATAASATLTVTGSVTEMQLELGTFPTSLIATTVGAVTRNADILSYPSAGNIVAAADTIYLEYTPNHTPSGTVYLWGTFVDANNSTQILHDGTNLIFRKRIANVNSDATIATAFVSGTRYKMAASWGSAGTSIVLNSVVGTGNANTTAAQIGTTMQTGADGNSASQPDIQVKQVRIWQTQLPNTTLQAITT